MHVSELLSLVSRAPAHMPLVVWHAKSAVWLMYFALTWSKNRVVHSNNNSNDRSITVGLNYAVFSLAMLIMDVDNACLMLNSSVVASSPTPPPGSDRASFVDSQRVAGLTVRARAECNRYGLS